MYLAQMKGLERQTFRVNGRKDMSSSLCMSTNVPFVGGSLV